MSKKKRRVRHGSNQPCAGNEKLPTAYSYLSNHAILNGEILNIYVKKTICTLFGLSSLLLVGGVHAQPRLLVPVPLAPLSAQTSPAADTMGSSAQAQQAQEPERWTQEDITLEEQLGTAKKETMAAYQIAVDECKSLPLPEQTSCLAQAKTEMEKEMATIRNRFGLTNP